MQKNTRKETCPLRAGERGMMRPSTNPLHVSGSSRPPPVLVAGICLFNERYCNLSGKTESDASNEPVHFIPVGWCRLRLLAGLDHQEALAVERDIVVGAGDRGHFVPSREERARRARSKSELSDDNVHSHHRFHDKRRVISRLSVLQSGFEQYHVRPACYRQNWTRSHISQRLSKVCSPYRIALLYWARRIRQSSPACRQSHLPPMCRVRLRG